MRPPGLKPWFGDLKHRKGFRCSIRFYMGDKSYRLSLYPISRCKGVRSESPVRFTRKRTKKVCKGNAIDKPYPYTFVYETRILWGSGTILRFGKVLSTQFALSVSSGFICLFYVEKLGCFY